MRHQLTIIALAVAVLPAMARAAEDQKPAAPAATQTAPSSNTTTGATNRDPSTPAVATPDTAQPAQPVPGANSFTETQARDRIEKKGFTNVTGLALDPQSIWRGKATKDGKEVSVSLDFQGNVFSN